MLSSKTLTYAFAALLTGTTQAVPLIPKEITSDDEQPQVKRTRLQDTSARVKKLHEMVPTQYGYPAANITAAQCSNYTAMYASYMNAYYARCAPLDSSSGACEIIDGECMTSLMPGGAHQECHKTRDSCFDIQRGCTHPDLPHCGADGGRGGPQGAGRPEIRNQPGL